MKKIYKREKIFVKGKKIPIPERLQCEWHDENGVRCQLTKKQNSIYCSKHPSVEVAKKYPERCYIIDLLKWIEENKLTKNGKLYSWEDYPHLKQLFRDKHPDISTMKGAQLGITEWGLLRQLAFLAEHRGTSSINTFPTRTEASRVSKQRIDSICSENDHVFDARNFEDDVNKKGRKHYDSVMEKMINKSFLFLQGTWQAKQSISTPADMLSHDEVDHSKGDVLTMFRSRIGNSDYKIIQRYSTPTYPEAGIHKYFLEGDQQHWWYKCEHCGHVFKLCCSYPDVIGYDEEDMTYYFRCVKCLKEISRKKGFYRPDNPTSLKRSYHISKMCAPRVSADDLMKSKESYYFERDFINNELGLPFAGEEDQITKADIDACEDGRFNLNVRDTYTTAGVDQGGNELFVVILKPVKDKLIVTYVDHLKGANCWRELSVITQQLGVVRGIIDALPDSFKANEFVKEWPKKFFANYYNDNQLENVIFQPKKNMTTINRNLSFDLMGSYIRTKRYVLPISEKLSEFKHQLTSLIRVKVQDGDNIKYVYKKVRMDHFANALNYATMASTNLEIRNFALYADKEAAKQIEDGGFSDSLLDALAIRVIENKISYESLAIYRESKMSGLMLEEMGLNYKEQNIMRNLENEYGVGKIVVTLDDFMMFKNRIEVVIQRKTELEKEESNAKDT